MFHRQRAKRDGRIDRILLALSIFMLLAALIWPATVAMGESQPSEEQRLWAAYERGEVIRLHVLADSDSEEDQQIKLSVRDAVIDAFGKALSQAGSQSSDDAYAALLDNREGIERMARVRALEMGFDGSVTAEVGVLHLPQKAYGSVVLPEGKYRALRITLGSGEGQNWWCVLYPQLCLALTGDGEDEDQAEATIDIKWESERIFSRWLVWEP